MRRSVKFGLGMLGLLATGTAFSQVEQDAPASSAGTAPPEEFDVALGELAERMTVAVEVAGRGPFNFVVDTGAERTVISRALADQLQLQPGRPVTMHSMGGVDQVKTVRIPHLGLNARTVSDIDAPALNETFLGAKGMLGVDTLQAQRVTFDFKKKTMSIAPSREARRSRGSGNDIIVTARSRFGRLVLVDASLDGQKIWVIVDTGSDATIGNSTLRNKLQKRHRLGQTIPVELISVMGENVAAEQALTRELQLGGVKMTRMPVAFADVPPFAKLGLQDKPALLLGMDALRTFSRVSVDFAERRVRFLLPDVSEAQSHTRLATR